MADKDESSEASSGMESDNEESQSATVESGGSEAASEEDTTEVPECSRVPNKLKRPREPSVDRLAAIVHKRNALAEAKVKLGNRKVKLQEQRLLFENDWKTKEFQYKKMLLEQNEKLMKYELELKYKNFLKKNEYRLPTI